MVGMVLAGCHSTERTEPSSPASGRQSADTQAGQEPEPLPADSGEPASLEPGTASQEQRGLVTSGEPPWPEPWPPGCKLTVVASAAVLPDGDVRNATILGSSCATVDAVVLQWLSAAKFEPLEEDDEPAIQTVTLSWTINTE